MTVIISTSKVQKHFKKNYIKIGSSVNSDLCLSLGFDFQLTMQYSEERAAFILTNATDCDKFFVKDKPLPKRCLLKNEGIINIKDSDDSISIKVVEEEGVLEEISEKTYSAAENPQIKVDITGKMAENKQNLFIQSEPKIKAAIKPEASEHIINEEIMQEKPQNVSKTPFEKDKTNIEKARTTVIKEVGFIVNDLKKRLQINSMGSIILHFAMLFASFVTAFGIANFLTGLKIEQAQNFINLPVNIKITLLFTGIIYGVCLVLKQGAFLWYENKVRPNASNKASQAAMLWASVLCFSAFYLINLLYYVNINPVFGILISLFFVGLTAVLACANGYFKYTLHLMSYELDKYEYREDFEEIMTDYRFWIEQFINKLGKGRIEKIKDKLFNLQIKSAGEIILGICTAPFLAYGVSNTLAGCFPEAAGWVRISGLRFSPVFLVLASFMIIFAFFAFVNAFVSTRKIQASSVIKQDGFSDYLTHGVDIYGVQGVQKLETEKKHSLRIAMAIVFIEFTMNTSYFFTEIGGDLQGVFLSLISATVPTALLIAETYMLSQTNFNIYACESLLDKRED